MTQVTIIHLMLWTLLFLEGRSEYPSGLTIEEKQTWYNAYLQCQKKGQMSLPVPKETTFNDLRSWVPGEGSRFWIGGRFVYTPWKWTDSCSMVHLTGCASTRPGSLHTVISRPSLSTLTPFECLTRCGTRYVALQKTTCFCLTSLPRTYVDQSLCHLRCSRNFDQSCGGYDSFASIYTMQQHSIPWDPNYADYLQSDCAFISLPEEPSPSMKNLHMRTSACDNSTTKGFKRFMCQNSSGNVTRYIDYVSWLGAWRQCSIRGEHLVNVRVQESLPLLFKEHEPEDYWIGLRRRQVLKWVNGSTAQTDAYSPPIFKSGGSCLAVYIGGGGNIVIFADNCSLEYQFLCVPDPNRQSSFKSSSENLPERCNNTQFPNQQGTTSFSQSPSTSTISTFSRVTRTSDVTTKSGDIVTQSSDVTTKSGDIVTQSRDGTAHSSDLATKFGDLTTRSGDSTVHSWDSTTKIADVSHTSGLIISSLKPGGVTYASSSNFVNGQMTGSTTTEKSESVTPERKPNNRETTSRVDEKTSDQQTNSAFSSKSFSPTNSLSEHTTGISSFKTTKQSPEVAIDASGIASLPTGISRHPSDKRTSPFVSTIKVGISTTLPDASTSSYILGPSQKITHKEPSASRTTKNTWTDSSFSASSGNFQRSTFSPSLPSPPVPSSDSKTNVILTSVTRSLWSETSTKIGSPQTDGSGHMTSVKSGEIPPPMNDEPDYDDKPIFIMIGILAFIVLVVFMVIIAIRYRRPARPFHQLEDDSSQASDLPRTRATTVTFDTLRGSENSIDTLRARSMETLRSQHSIEEDPHFRFVESPQ